MFLRVAGSAFSRTARPNPQHLQTDRLITIDIRRASVRIRQDVHFAAGFDRGAPASEQQGRGREQ